MKHLNHMKAKISKGKCLMTKKELKEYMNWVNSFANQKTVTNKQTKTKGKKNETIVKKRIRTAD